MITRCQAAFAKVQRRCFTFRNPQIRYRRYRPVPTSTNRPTQFFHSHERPVIGYPKLSCEHHLHGACSSISKHAGYRELQQRSQKRPLIIGAVGEPNCCITTKASIDERLRISRRILKPDQNKELMIIFMLRTTSQTRKAPRYEVTCDCGKSSTPKSLKSSTWKSSQALIFLRMYRILCFNLEKSNPVLRQLAIKPI